MLRLRVKKAHYLKIFELSTEALDISDTKRRVACKIDLLQGGGVVNKATEAYSAASTDVPDAT